jgi:hypothetical protein
MLTHTFIHIQGVGPRTEKKLWESGLTEWGRVCPEALDGLSPRTGGLLLTGIAESVRRLEANDAAYFGRRLPANQAWRMFPEFRSTVGYVDIETTGLDRDRDAITTIALYDGSRVRTYVRGRDLDRFVEDVRDFRVLVTYNGLSFDVPFLERHFHTRLPQAQIDLRFILKSLGFSGGLKTCERKMGLDRGALADVDGFLAVMLWERYRRTGDTKALETLLAYNVQDTLNLEHLLVAAYNQKLGDTACGALELIPQALPPENPFRVDRGTIDALKGRVFSDRPEGRQQDHS